MLTGTALLLLVVSESGVVYTYTTEACEVQWHGLSTLALY